jgi:predicted Ser/Thr protein kinase
MSRRSSNGLHYKKDGTLDMRYSSSKAAMGYSSSPRASSYGSTSYSSSSSSHRSTSGYSTGSSAGDLHYKKDGSLDMRYASSKQAVASGYSPGYSGDELHYKKDGSLDMRYTSSKQAVASGYSPGYSGDELHHKKDGSLDMRYTSSKQAVASGYSPGYSGDELHHKKDGSLDMRYTSSKQAVASGTHSSSYSSVSHMLYVMYDLAVAVGTILPKMTICLFLIVRFVMYSLFWICSHLFHLIVFVLKFAAVHIYFSIDNLHYTLTMFYCSCKAEVGTIAGQLEKTAIRSSARQKALSYNNFPDYVPRKKDGTPDMRTRAAKEWVASQAAISQGPIVPSWVPQDKYGVINLQSAVGWAFAQLRPTVNVNVTVNLRGDYWTNRLRDEEFSDSVAKERCEVVELPPRAQVLPDPVPMQAELTQATPSEETTTTDVAVSASLPEGALLIDYQQLEFKSGEEEMTVLGRGTFGVVLKAKLTGVEVAVKKLHLDQLTAKEKRTFRKELIILAHLGTHPNLVKLIAYCISPPCLVMELIQLGSLTSLLHYCEDPKVEAKITDGRVKKTIVFGIANGMLQLHTSKVVHGDLKPQNVLITDAFEAKLADFGLAYFRGKTSSTVASSKMADEDREEVGGTAGYMAPELLDSVNPPEYSSDVYSFGILLNEVIAEEEPFCDQYANFAARGPFGAANYAKQGMRPTIAVNTPDTVKKLITSCWAPDAKLRPTFNDIVSAIEDTAFTIPNSF